jgi:hypothetical protein
MKQIFEKFRWTDKPELKREQILIVSIVAVLIVGFFKFQPYFQEPTKVVINSEKTEQVKTPQSFLEKFGLTRSESSTKNTSRNNISGGANYRGVGNTSNNANKNAIIERPLFDGLEVVLKGTLMNSISSLASENPADVKVTGFIPNEITQGMDDSEVMGAQLKGVVTANYAKKILNISFAQIITSHGRSYPVAGYAVDLTNKSLGIAAEYSSGLPKRLLGTVIDRAIVVGDQLGMSALISGSVADPTQAAIQMAAMDANQQAASELSREATQDLRSTQPELSVPAGTTIAFKIRVQQGASNGY